MKQQEIENNSIDWTFQEDQFLAQQVQSLQDIKWHKVTKRINKVFHNKQEVRKSNKVKRRWEKVIRPVQQLKWSRNDAQKFCTLSSQYVHSSRRFWNRLKKEFKGYTYKMLLHKLKQLKELNQAQFVLEHKNLIVQRQFIPNGYLSVLCKNLESFQQNFNVLLCSSS